MTGPALLRADTDTDTDTDADTAVDAIGLDEILRRVRALAPRITARSEEIEDARRLPRDLVEALRHCGVFRATMPAEWGGPQLTSMEQIALIEEVSAADAAVGWCVMIGMDSGIYAGHLTPDAAAELYPRLDLVTAGWVAPAGQAHETAGGYIVDGHWRFGSGCTHADVIAGGCTVYRDGKPLLDDAGEPVTRIVLAPAASFAFEDTWHTTGLAGTGSCDYTTEKLFVPAEHTLSFDEPRRDAPMYRRSDTVVRKMPGVPLGLARSAIDHVHGIVDQRFEGAGVPWRSSRHVQAVLAECEMQLTVARSAVHATVEAVWDRLVAGGQPTRKERADAALARYHAFRSARIIATALYDLVGGDATHRSRTPLDRAVRDSTTACQHVVGQRRILEWSGQLLLGDEPGAAFV
ncbi:acyl-CoA dehydrogenase family protein [Streptomyces sp. NBC_01136]|uniref:acyl-CoA dehydrogenase family protein n=1 Tax=Streptomyces sp. NBC_01136 TaxID=2903754 RepID=UPI00386E6D1C|nr:acyl-CoA dehydrogenase family protein [Streptomyces sp. NBC_01136]